MDYRKATVADAEKIAHLHTVSWQKHYRGMLDDHYLDNEALADRTKVWKERLKFPQSNMRLFLVEDEGQLVGFGCLFLGDDLEYGALLDNLHVADSYAGKGVGKGLMAWLSKEITLMGDRKDMYLWVLEKNVGAIGFYERQNGLRKERAIETGMGNRPVEKIRYYWPDVHALMANL